MRTLPAPAVRGRILCLAMLAMAGLAGMASSSHGQVLGVTDAEAVIVFVIEDALERAEILTGEIDYGRPAIRINQITSEAPNLMIPASSGMGPRIAERLGFAAVEIEQLECRERRLGLDCRIPIPDVNVLISATVFEINSERSRVGIAIYGNNLRGRSDALGWYRLRNYTLRSEGGTWHVEDIVTIVS